MKPIRFKQANVTYAEDQPEYLPLPAHKVGNREGEVITCWQVSFLERLQILIFGKMWFRQLTFYNPLQPVNMSTASPFKTAMPLRARKAFAFWIWRNLSGGSVPFYDSPKLARFQAPTAPQAGDWRGLKLKLWNRAKNYLVSIGELTYTPTMRGRF